MARFDGKVAIVTGGASGIGLATVERMAAEGGTVVITDVQDEKGQEAAQRLVDQGYKASYKRLDVVSESDWQRVVALAPDSPEGATAAKALSAAK